LLVDLKTENFCAVLSRKTLEVSMFVLSEKA